MSNKYKSLYEQGIAQQFSKARVRVKYEPYSISYERPVRGGQCIFCRDHKQPHKVVQVSRYIPDWVSEDDSLIVESKGKFTSADRTKMIAVIAAHPDKDIRLLFMRDNWLTRKKLDKYSDWCIKHNVTYAIGEVPKEWIKEFKQRQLTGISRQAKRKK